MTQPDAATFHRTVATHEYYGIKAQPPKYFESLAKRTEIKSGSDSPWTDHRGGDDFSGPAVVNPSALLFVSIRVHSWLLVPSKFGFYLNSCCLRGLRKSKKISIA